MYSAVLPFLTSKSMKDKINATAITSHAYRTSPSNRWAVCHMTNSVGQLPVWVICLPKWWIDGLIRATVKKETNPQYCHLTCRTAKDRTEWHRFVTQMPRQSAVRKHLCRHLRSRVKGYIVFNRPEIIHRWVTSLFQCVTIVGTYLLPSINLLSNA